MSSPAADMVACALASSDAAAMCTQVLAILRDAFTADAAVLARAAASVPEIVHTDTAAPARIATGPLAAALASPEPLVVHGGKAGESIVAMRLEPRPNAPWSVGLVRRKGHRWSSADQEALIGLRPHLLLILAHALLQEELAAAHAHPQPSGADRERELAVLSHELRNSLAPILMWASALKRLRPDDEEVQRATQAITHAVNLERQLIEDLSDVSRLERGVLGLSRESVDLCSVVREVLALRQKQIDEAKLLVTSVLPPERVPIHGDRARLGQAVGNVLGNAIKFTPAGGAIAITLARDDGTATLSVSDSGSGLPEELAGRLFVPFAQGPNAHGGLGVGLAIARRLIELHGGAIEAHGQGDLGGASLSIRLPLGE